ncbi:hypothetical protein ABZ543_12800 [Streptomyces roseifaciens]
MMYEPIKASRRQEKAVAKKVGGQVTPASGSGWAVKNDVRSNDWSLECKWTAAKSYRLSSSDLKHAERNALLDGRDMAFVVEMCGRTWVTVSEATFLRLITTPEDS